MAEKENEEILEEVEVDTPAEEIPEESAASGVEDKITAAEDKAKAAEDKYLRLYAEFDNYKKRTQREKDARYARRKLAYPHELGIRRRPQRAMDIAAVGV